MNKNIIADTLKKTLLEVTPFFNVPPDVSLGTYWNPNLHNGRETIQLAGEPSLEKTAKINLALFGRGTTLNERLFCLAYKQKILNSGNSNLYSIKISIDDDDRETFFCIENGAEIEIKIGKNNWKMLRIIDEEYYEIKNGLVDRIPSEAAIGRTLKNLFQHKMTLARYNFINSVIVPKLDNKEESIGSLFDVIRSLSFEKDIINYRNSQGFPGIEGLPLSLVHDFKLVDEFIKFLQAVCYYKEDVSTIIGLALARDVNEQDGEYPDYGISINMLFSDKANIIDHEKVFNAVLLASHDLIEPMKGSSANHFEGAPNDKFKEAVTSMNRSLVLTDKCQKFKEVLNKFPLIMNLFSAMDILSNAIHESKPLSFTFLYGGGDVWRIEDDILSEEDYKNYLSLDVPHDFAKIVEQHWSIFQGDRVVGFIDKTKPLDGANKGGIPFDKIIKVNSYSQIQGRLLQECVRVLDDSIVVTTSGKGKVKIFYKESPDSERVVILVWDTIKNEIEDLSADLATVADSIVKLYYNENEDIRCQRAREMIEETFLEVSEARGEGALIIVGKEEDIHPYLREMDLIKNRMSWRNGLQLCLLDKTLLRSLFILDGATWFKTNTEVMPRFVVYPNCNCNGTHAFSALCELNKYDESKENLEHVCDTFKSLKDNGIDLLRSNIEILNGKGSKHHGAANLSCLLYLKGNEKGKEKNYSIYTISEDGPIKEWPDAILPTKGEA